MPRKFFSVTPLPQKKSDNFKSKSLQKSATKVTKPKKPWNNYLTDGERYKLSESELKLKKLMLSAKKRFTLSPRTTPNQSFVNDENDNDSVNSTLKILLARQKINEMTGSARKVVRSLTFSPSSGDIQLDDSQQSISHTDLKSPILNLKDVIHRISSVYDDIKGNEGSVLQVCCLLFFDST